MGKEPPSGKLRKNGLKIFRHKHESIPGHTLLLIARLFSSLEAIYGACLFLLF